MASLQGSPKVIGRIVDRAIIFSLHSRAFRSSSRSLAAQNFTMPAMSPTMTEGNIASWKVKEGDSFSTGDVLLEIETDKAQMDVEAQDDGQMAKITQEAGAKGVKVGSRIAIIAEQDDDLSSLELPAEGPPSQPSPPSKETKSGADSSKSSESPSEAPPTSTDVDVTPSISSKSIASGTKPQKQTYPLYPSITQLLHEKGLPSSEADKMPASGPKGRLLKGDVLAYLGTINSSYSSEQSARIAKLGHLDITNAAPAPRKEAAPAKSSTPKEAMVSPELESEPDTQIAVPISLSSVLSVQKRIRETLGVTLPLSTFIARAIELANDDLPRSPHSKPTADELFNDVLGLNKVPSAATSRGSYIPQITAMPSSSLTEPATRPRKQLDVYDILTGSKPSMTSTKDFGAPPPGIMAGSKVGDANNVFSISATKGEEKRARVFLERVKTILQVEPGRLIL